MSDHSQDFIAYLANLQDRDRRPLAELRRSLSFAPGTYPPAYPYVERFVGRQDHANDSSRLALYLVAGLYATHPELSDNSLAYALGQLMSLRESDSIEKRFIALLSADAENVHYYLRQIVSLLAADGLGVNYAALLNDLRVWLNPHGGDQRDRIRQRWARDFYRALESQAKSSTTQPIPTGEAS
jgi:CRISPR system Cascade subunit CasB